MDKILFIGLDVDSKNYHLAGLSREGEVFQAKCKSDISFLINILKSWQSKGFSLRICYESSYIGFSLHRQLVQNGFSCEVIAASLIPKVGGDRVKTDRLDSLKLAEFFMNDLLTRVHVPSLEQEGARDITRTHHFYSDQVKKTKQFIIALCFRYHQTYRDKENEKANYWTQSHRRWLCGLAENHELVTLRTNLRMLLFTLDSLEQQKEECLLEIKRLSESNLFSEAASALSCYRGFDVLSAMVLITEIGDVKRFKHPSALVSYVGLDMSEKSSGGVSRKGRITKFGNKFVRKTLVEATQSCKRPPQIHVSLKNRRKNCSPKYIEIADRCMHRLYKKSQRLLNREKPSNKVKIACARELICFVWESLNKVEQLQPELSA